MEVSAARIRPTEIRITRQKALFHRARPPTDQQPPAIVVTLQAISCCYAAFALDAVVARLEPDFRFSLR